MDQPVKIYLDNNIYNYLVDEDSIPETDVKKLIKAVNANVVEVLFSPVNLFEIVRCFENKEEKAKKMVERSYALSKKVTIPPNDVLVMQLKMHLNKFDFSNSNIYDSSDPLFNKIRNGILKSKSYRVPIEFHERIKNYASWYINRLNTMKDEINNFLSKIQFNNFTKIDINYTNSNPIDLYNIFNGNPSSRKMHLEAVFKDRCHYEGDLSKIISFNDIPSFSIFWKYYLKVAYELILRDKKPNFGDWADLDQTVYFYYADFIVTSDTGKAGLFPNYRGILSEVLQPMNKSAIKFSTLISKLENLK